MAPLRLEQGRQLSPLSSGDKISRLISRCEGSQALMGKQHASVAQDFVRSAMRPTLDDLSTLCDRPILKSGTKLKSKELEKAQNSMMKSLQSVPSDSDHAHCVVFLAAMFRDAYHADIDLELLVEHAQRKQAELDGSENDPRELEEENTPIFVDIMDVVYRSFVIPHEDALMSRKSSLQPLCLEQTTALLIDVFELGWSICSGRALSAHKRSKAWFSICDCFCGIWALGQLSPESFVKFVNTFRSLVPYPNEPGKLVLYAVNYHIGHVILCLTRYGSFSLPKGFVTEHEVRLIDQGVKFCLGKSLKDHCAVELLTELLWVKRIIGCPDQDAEDIVLKAYSSVKVKSPYYKFHMHYLVSCLCAVRVYTPPTRTHLIEQSPPGSSARLPSPNDTGEDGEYTSRDNLTMEDFTGPLLLEDCVLVVDESGASLCQAVSDSLENGSVLDFTLQEHPSWRYWVGVLLHLSETSEDEVLMALFGCESHTCSTKLKELKLWTAQTHSSMYPNGRPAQPLKVKSKSKAKVKRK